MRDGECSEFRGSLIAVLGAFEALSDMLLRFVQQYQSEARAAELIAAFENLRHASDDAAALVRKRLRRRADRGAES